MRCCTFLSYGLLCLESLSIFTKQNNLGLKTTYNGKSLHVQNQLTLPHRFVCCTFDSNIFTLHFIAQPLKKLSIRLFKKDLMIE